MRIPSPTSNLKSTQASCLRGAVIAAGLVFGCLVGGRAFAESEPSESRAAAYVGVGESPTIALIRELSEWRSRALEAEALLSRSGVRTSAQTFLGASVSPARVLGSLEAERLIILSIGRSSGALQGAILSVGGGVVAKVVESRESVAAALVDRSYKGKLANLDGLPVQLAVR